MKALFQTHGSTFLSGLFGVLVGAGIVLAGISEGQAVGNPAGRVNLNVPQEIIQCLQLPLDQIGSCMCGGPNSEFTPFRCLLETAN